MDGQLRNPCFPDQCDCCSIEANVCLAVITVMLASKMVTGKENAHNQECPPYENQHGFKTANTCNAKIFVIDDRSHTNMLLASEY